MARCIPRTIQTDANYADSDRDRRSRTEPSQQPEQLRPRQRDAAVRGVPGVVVQKDPAATARHGGRDVVLHDGELPVGDPGPPECLAGAVERRRRAAGEVPEAVVGGRARILVPPVAAAQAVIRERHAGVRIEAVDRRPDREGAGRGRPVALPVPGGEAAVADPRAPGAEDPATAFADGERRRRRVGSGRDHLDALRAGEHESERKRQHRGGQSTLPAAWPLCRRSTLRLRP